MTNFVGKRGIENAIQASVSNHGSKPASDWAIPLSSRLLVFGLWFILRVAIVQDGILIYSRAKVFGGPRRRSASHLTRYSMPLNT